MEKRNKIIIIAIVLALVVLCSGLTYAYFTSAVNSESGSTIIAKGGTMYVIYDNGSGDIVAENIYPREKEWVSKKFTVTGNNTTDLNMYYRVSMVIDNNDFSLENSGLYYTLTSENTSNNGEVIPTVTNHTTILDTELLSGFYNEEVQVLGTGMFTKGQNQIHTYTLKIFFDDSGTDKDNRYQGKSFAAHLVIDSINENGDVVLTGDSNVYIDPFVKTKTLTKTFKVTSNLNAEQDYKINLDVKMYASSGNDLKYTLTSANEGKDGTTINDIQNGEITQSNNEHKISLGNGKLSSKKSVHSYTLTFIGDEESMHYLFAKVEVKKNLPELKTLILGTNNQNVLSDKATLTTSFDESGDKAGLYSSTDTNSGNPTYFFRGNVENNNVKFAGLNWKILRINEDGSIRLIMNDGIYDNKNLGICSTSSCSNSSYRTQGENTDSENEYAYTSLNSWFNTKLSSYSNEYITETSFCEEYKVKDTSSESSDAIQYEKYTSDFKCSKTANENYEDRIGMISIDELIHAGGYFHKTSNIFLNSEKSAWSLSRSVRYSGMQGLWTYSNEIAVTLHWQYGYSTGGLIVRPVISLKSDVTASGNGTASNPYVTD